MDKEIKVGDIVLICGYRGHGKNTFAEWMQKLNELSFNSFNSLSSLRNPSLKYNEISFAKYLKEYVAKLFNISLDILEKRKNEKLMDSHKYYQFIKVQPEILSYPTYRDVLIDIAAIKREKNPDYFVMKAIEKYYDKSAVNLITDFRYENEYLYIQSFFELTRINIITIRVFRNGATIPSKNILSEHNLNNFVTDYYVTSN